MKNLAMVLVLCSMSYALQAPYLISATAQSNGSVSLSWRNNDLSTIGYIVQRRDSTEATYKFIDSVKSVAMLTYADSKKLLPTTLYTYQVIAYSAASVSDTSNSVQVTTLANPRTAPNLTSATALGRRIVSLAWQDGNKMTWGFLIQRKDSTETVYHFIDSIKSATLLTYTDTIGLRPGKLYAYRINAYYGGMDVQDTSNSLQATTKPDIFKLSSISVYWSLESSSSVQITINDISNCEIGYQIYRSNDLKSSSFNLVTTIVSSNPDSIGTIVWNDNTVGLNQLYYYKVAAFKNDSSIICDAIPKYTLHSVPMGTKVVFQKLGDFPISLSGLSAKAGDSIIIKENPSPAGKYSAININDPAHPKFDGYIDSTSLLSYPMQTLIPAFLKFGVYNGLSNARVIQHKDKMLICQTNNINMFQIQNNNLVLLDSITLPSGSAMSQMALLNDTLLAFIANDSFYRSESGMIMSAPYSWSYSGHKSFLYSIQLTNSGFSSFPIYTIPETNDLYSFVFNGSESKADSLGYSFIHGYFNGEILISINQLNSSTTNSTTPRDSTAKVALVNAGEGIVDTWGYPKDGWFNSATSNTGYYLSPTENLCTAGPALFVADIRDLPDGYHTALANHAVYRDSASLTPQNILLDTLNKMVYVFYSTKLSILSYQRQAVGVANGANKLSVLKGISVIPNASRSGVTIVLPSNSNNADLFIYDLSGRVVEKMRNITSNAVFWRPKTKSMACYIVMVKSAGQTHTMKFMTR